MLTILAQEARQTQSSENGWSISDQLVGDSPAMVQLRTLIHQAANSRTTVLITGESGTGKELIAHALHNQGRRSTGPFIAVNGAALSETLLESELFGHEKGAFTGAIMRHRGKFEQAHGGTIFFDEIGDMPLLTQARILRVLQERCFQRLGGEERLNVDVRVICATNHDLEKSVRVGDFRHDLFYRVYVFVIEVPPLRERKTDIPLLARHFVQKFSRSANRSAPDISPQAMAHLYQHNWPGNVRELENAIERSLIVCNDAAIEPAHLPAALLHHPPHPQQPATLGKTQNLIETVRNVERNIILGSLQENDWNKTKAARTLGITRRMLIYKMANLEIAKTRIENSLGVFQPPGELESAAQRTAQPAK